eukprot:scaffold187419_cov17-Tisochrysis_lutea.AAC.2
MAGASTASQASAASWATISTCSNTPACLAVEAGELGVPATPPMEAAKLPLEIWGSRLLDFNQYLWGRSPSALVQQRVHSGCPHPHSPSAAHGGPTAATLLPRGETR